MTESLKVFGKRANIEALKQVVNQIDEDTLKETQEWANRAWSQIKRNKSWALTCGAVIAVGIAVYALLPSGTPRNVKQKAR